jgi:NADH dehydrogenase [ubiquinone] 1 alpha subcomplex assembly factor 3
MALRQATMFRSKNLSSSVRIANISVSNHLTDPVGTANRCTFVRSCSQSYHTSRVDLSSKRNFDARGISSRRREFHSGASRYDGKMTDIIGNDEFKTELRAFGDSAFLVNDTVVRQSVILLPNSFYLWNVKTFEDITIESLSMFPILHPTIEILLLGCGKKTPFLPLEIRKHFQSKGIVIELSTTSYAASTFNILNQEGRNVAAAMITLEVPKRIEVAPFDYKQLGVGDKPSSSKGNKA